jgi:hypothetical protein
MKASKLEDILGALPEKWPLFFQKLGNIESWWVLELLSEISIERPVYITGLARSGTTVLLEILSSHPETGTHQYRDYPFLQIPLWWNWFYNQATKREISPVERVHKDGIYITPKSPEAMEEILWMMFFSDCHSPETNNCLTGQTNNSGFEKFYFDHIKKILLIRKASRYLAKGNYNIARLEYLHKLFSDAIFIVLIRDPVWHIASLIKQHLLLRKEEKKDPRILNYMRRSGHFEFGLDLRPINIGDFKMIETIQELWQDGHDVRAWAMYWAMVYDHLLTTLKQNTVLAEQVKIVFYENFCEEPLETLLSIYSHCELEVSKDIVNMQASKIRIPAYNTGFTKNEKAIIHEETKTVFDAIKSFAEKDF